MSVLELTNVSKRYRSGQLFTSVDLTVDEGRIYGITGANGSGKSVLFRILAGFVRPDTGTVVIDPRYRGPHDAFPTGFGIIIDRPGYLAHKSGLENLMALARIRGLVGEAQVRQSMADFGLNPDSRTRVGNYSLGMKQRLSIAQATMEGQRVLLLDEPFNALDRDSVEHLRDRLERHREAGGTVVFTSHNAQDIERLADDVYEIAGGTLRRV